MSSAEKKNASQSKADKKSNDQKDKDVTKNKSVTQQITASLKECVWKLTQTNPSKIKPKLRPGGAWGDVWGLLGTSWGPVQQNQSQFEGF